MKLSQRRGSVIVLVLVFVVLLTFIVTAFLQEATARIKYYGLFHNRDDLRTDAYSAMEVTLAVLNQYLEIEGALWGPAQGWGFPLQEAGYSPAHANSVRVSFEDESAKLPLSTLEYDDLLVLFDVMGFDLPDAQSLADGILDWTDEDDLRRLNGFDGEDYEDMEPPYRPANSDILTWDEFKLIEPANRTFWDETGRPTAAWNRFQSAVSLYHTGPVNINHASPLVQEYLYEKGLLDIRALSYYLDGADGIMGTEDDRLYRRESGALAIELGEGGELSDRIQLLRIKVEAMRGEARFILEALVSWAGSAGAANEETEAAADDEAQSVQESRPTTAREARDRARGSALTTASEAAQLNYPFRFVHLSENRKF